MARKDKTITAENQFTDFLRISEKGVVTLEGTFSATLTLQMKKGGTSGIIDVDTVTTGGRYTFDGYGDDWRIGVKTGGYSSGTIEARIQQGE